MTHAFPEESVRIFQQWAEIFKKTYPKDSNNRYKCAAHLASVFFGENYGFRGHLVEKNYAPWPHERKALNIESFNCTTIIPEIYLVSEVLDLKPRIVQFLGFRDIENDGKPEEYFNPSHFSLVLDVGRKHKYLLDPFWKTFGPIIEENKNFIRIGKNNGNESKKKTREFNEMLHHSPEDFSDMMERMHDPAESLDMLTAGQKIFSERFVESRFCEVMIYYHEAESMISTRLEIPQVGILDKAIFCNMYFNGSGGIDNTTLDFFSAKSCEWDDITEGKKVAAIDFPTLEEFRRIIRRILRENSAGNGKYKRIGHLIESSEHKGSLIEIIESMNLSEEERKDIEFMAGSRMEYEFTEPKKEYLYSEEEHNAKIMESIEKSGPVLQELQPIEKTLYLHKTKLKVLDRNEVNRLRRRKTRLQKELNKLNERIESHNRPRYRNKKMYKRLMDIALFGKKNGSWPVVCGHDPIIGHICMINDFIPYAFSARNDLELEMYVEDIQQRIKARKS